MKWIGQHIVDLIARFRGDVYLDSPTAAADDPDRFLALDTNKKIVYRTGTELLSDIGAGTGTVSFDGSTANGVLTYKDADEATVESNLTFDGSTVTLTGDISATGDSFLFQSANADDPLFQIKNTTADNQGARLQFTKDRGAAMVDNDRIGEVDFVGEDASQNTQQYGKIMVQAVETDHGIETGKMRLQVAEYDGTQTDGLLIVGQDADGEVDVTIGAGAASTTTISGTLTMGSTATINNSGEIQVASQPSLTTLAGVSAIGSAGTPITITSDTVTFTSANADDPAIWIKNTANDNQATRMLFLKERTASGIQDAQDGDECGAIYFYSYDDGTPSLQKYGYIESTIHDATSGQESGKLDIGVGNHDGGAEPGISMQGGSENGEVDVTIGSGANSLTTIAGDLGITTGLILDSVDVTTIQTGSESHSDNDTSLMTSAAILDLIQSATFLTPYHFLGYTIGDGSNYEHPQGLTDNQSPFEHATTSSADGLTIPASAGTNQSELMRFGGKLMATAGTLKKWVGTATNTNNKDLTIGLFKWTPPDNSAGDITPVLLDEVVIAGKGNDLTRTFSTTSFDQTSVAAGDIIFTQMKTESSGNVAYFNSTLEILH